MLVLMKLPALALLTLFCSPGWSQGTVPTFDSVLSVLKDSSYTLLGAEPGKGGTTTIPTVLVPIDLVFEAGRGGAAIAEKAGPDVPAILHSPIFTKFAFAMGGTTQYADAMLRSSFPGNAGWHTLLGKPSVMPVTITVPRANGYVLSSKHSGTTLGVADADFVQAQLFKKLGPQTGVLVLAVAHNTTFYADGDATICCTTGTHGIDPATGSSFVLGAYLHGAPAIVDEKDVQPLTEQLAEFVKDPRHNPQHYGYNVTAPGNAAPAWTWPNMMRSKTMRPGKTQREKTQPGNQTGCGGTGLATSYFLLEPTDINLKNNIPNSPAFSASVHGIRYHLQNVALLPWYEGSAAPAGSTFSFPDARVLTEAATPCVIFANPNVKTSANPDVKMDATAPDSVNAPAIASNGHRLIGYWTGHGAAGTTLPLRDVSPQWNVVIAAFAAPASDLPEGTLRFHVPNGIDPAQFKSDIALLKSQGRKVMLSLGGGGAFFKLDDPASIPAFVNSVTAIVEEYGFEGVDIDFESPSLVLAPGDVDFKRPTTPSVVNLIAGLRQLREHFGAGFMLSLVPEGPQILAGYSVYGGQFGSYLPIAYALRGILSFVDAQDYNTPPFEGLDGEIYQSHTVDYHAAMTELLLHGFNVGQDPRHFFPPLPADKVAVGFLTNYDTPQVVSEAMGTLITGHAAAGSRYRLLKPTGYPGLIGAMFWTIDDDRLLGLEYSNVVGPQLHTFPPAP